MAHRKRATKKGGSVKKKDAKETPYVKMKLVPIAKSESRQSVQAILNPTLDALHKTVKTLNTNVQHKHPSRANAIRQDKVRRANLLMSALGNDHNTNQEKNQQVQPPHVNAHVVAQLPDVNIPDIYVKKKNALFKLLLNRGGDSIGRSPDGELVIGNQALKGTEYNAVINASYVNSRRKPAGLDEFVQEVKRLGGTQAMFSSKAALRAYNAQDGKGCFPPGRPMNVLRVYK